MSIRWILGNKYSINRESARSGGTATVYRALDLDSAVSVAIKMFDRGAMASDLTKEAYQRELKCLSELNSHPNIAKLLDFGEEANTGNPFIVMEWLEKSLLDVIAENAIKNWDHFYDHYGKPLLEALSFAHRRDIIHRDVKPANVMFTPAGELRLVDFGISKFKAWWGSGLTFQDWKSRPYSAPENDNFEYVNTKDVYSFAALAIACLENRELNESENVLSILEGLSVDRHIYDVLVECLSERPEDRPASVDNLIDTFDRLAAPTNSVDLVGHYNCYLELTNHALQRLEISLGIQGRASIENSVASDLTEVCGIERHKENQSHFNLYAATHLYHVAIDQNSNRHFVIVGAQRKESWRLEHHRQFLFSPKIAFHVGRPPGSDKVQKNTIALLEAIDEWDADSEGRKERALIARTENTWRALLRLQLDLERTARDEVRYRRFSLDEGVIEFEVDADNLSDLVGQDRIIQVPNARRSYLVNVESVTHDRVLGRIDGASAEDIPSSGVLNRPGFPGHFVASKSESNGGRHGTGSFYRRVQTGGGSAGGRARPSGCRGGSATGCFPAQPLRVAEEAPQARCRHSGASRGQASPGRVAAGDRGA